MKKLRFWLVGAVIGSMLSQDFYLMVLDPLWWVVAVVCFGFYAIIEYTLITPAIKDFQAFMRKRKRGKGK